MTPSEQPPSGQQPPHESTTETAERLRKDSLGGDDFTSPDVTLDLVHRAQAGDREAFDELCSKHQERIRRIVRIRLGSRLKAKLESMDIVQEALLVAYHKLSDARFEAAEDVVGWLATIALNQIRDANRYWKAQKRNGELSPPPTQTSIGQRAFKAEVRETMDEAMQDLSEEHREVILLHDYYGASFEAVGKRLGCSEGAARELHRRAWSKLTSLVGRRLGKDRDR